MDFYPSLPSPYSKPIEQQFVRVKDLVQERWRKWRIESVIAVKMHFTETIFMLDPSPPSPFWTAILHPFRLNDRALSVWWRKWRIKVVPFFKLCSGKRLRDDVLRQFLSVSHVQPISRLQPLKLTQAPAIPHARPEENGRVSQNEAFFRVWLRNICPPTQ